ncbi:hypothetical protein B0H12DRAFT_1083185 [Mycena haematopus]|nr:hypothetical protein B0H12DRAFT_1083185 [Mycena haematopus]
MAEAAEAAAEDLRMEGNEAGKILVEPAGKRSRKEGRHDGNVHGRGRARGISTKGEYCNELNTAKSRKYSLNANRLGMKPGSQAAGWLLAPKEHEQQREWRKGMVKAEGQEIPEGQKRADPSGPGGAYEEARMRPKKEDQKGPDKGPTGP